MKKPYNHLLYSIEIEGNSLLMEKQQESKVNNDPNKNHENCDNHVREVIANNRGYKITSNQHQKPGIDALHKRIKGECMADIFLGKNNKQ